ncbi:MAG: TonB-dependent receptor [Bacteroidetes bacterium]|nr:MAG: TonB-dependent receptor [Bacteroidota bacterium]
MHSSPLLRIIFISVLFWAATGLQAQPLNGTLRGIVLDHYSRLPLPATQVWIEVSGDTLRTQSDAKGLFRLEVPVGRHNINFTRKGYLAHTENGVLLVSAKELRLEILLEENYYQLDEVNLYPTRQKGTTRNRMASVSALSFEPEETRKIAGGLDDPTRVAASMPGVVGSPYFSENYVSVRGNSPRGMLYRLEGIDIPNPTHFARIGSSSGTFTIFSNQLLSNSDFFIGAFPAEYGNATSGVFDITFREGNNEKHEFALQAGVLGIDISAEGPLSARHKGSYLVNYRYATLNFAKHLIGYLSTPTYHDLSFKINLPTEKAGTFSLFGIGGLSNRLKPAEPDSLWAVDLDRFELQLRSDMGALGLNHKYLFTNGTLISTSLVGSYSFQRDNKTYMETPISSRQREKVEYRRLPITFTSFIQHNFSQRHTNKTGVIVTGTHHNFVNLNYNYIENQLNTLVNEQGNTFMVQAYSQSQFKIARTLVVNAGLHAIYYNLNKDYSVEPRAGISWQFEPRQTLSAGYGLHSRVEDYATYMTRLNSGGTYTQPNLNLQFLRSHHFVLGYQAFLSDHLKFRAETYYQHLFDVPVEATGTYSVLNLDELDQLRILVNEGTARNVGLDMGLERFSRRGLYYMLNGSIFSSTYTDAAGLRHSTAFNSGYKANLLMGKEFRLGRKKGGNTLMGLNTNFSLIGGQRYTPISLDASRLARETVYDEIYPFTIQEDPLFLVDFTFTLNRNHVRYNSTWAIQIKNIFQSAAAEYREYDPTLDAVVAQEGSSFFPVLSYKIQF